MTGSDSDSKNKTSLEGKFDPSSLGVPAGRAGTEEDMAGTILYLSSRAGQCASFRSPLSVLEPARLTLSLYADTNGAIIPVDGGTLLTNPSAY